MQRTAKKEIFIVLKTLLVLEAIAMMALTFLPENTFLKIQNKIPFASSLRELLNTTAGYVSLILVPFVILIILEIWTERHNRRKEARERKETAMQKLKEEQAAIERSESQAEEEASEPQSETGMFMQGDDQTESANACEEEICIQKNCIPVQKEVFDEIVAEAEKQSEEQQDDQTEEQYEEHQQEQSKEEQSAEQPTEDIFENIVTKATGEAFHEETVCESDVTGFYKVNEMEAEMPLENQEADIEQIVETVIPKQNEEASGFEQKSETVRTESNEEVLPEKEREEFPPIEKKESNDVLFSQLFDSMKYETPSQRTGSGKGSVTISDDTEI